MDRLESIELVVALLSITVMRLLESILESSKKIKILNLNIEKEDCPVKEDEYSYAAEPPVQFRLSHLSRRSEPL